MADKQSKNEEPIPAEETPTPAPESFPDTTDAPVVEEASKPVEAANPQQSTQPNAKPNGFAIAALVVGIIAAMSGWIPFWGLLVGITAIVLGVLGLKTVSGKGMAIAGIVTGAVGALTGLLVVIFFTVTLVNFSSVREAASQRAEQNQALDNIKKMYSKGETANFANIYTVRVNTVSLNHMIDGATPAPGKQFIKVNVTVKNISGARKYLMPSSFTVSNNGLARNPSQYGNETPFIRGYIEAGETKTGDIVYEVDADSSTFLMQYVHNTYDDSYDRNKRVYSLEF